MREFTTDDDVKEFLEHVDAWLDEPVTVFLVGGTALTIRGLSARTEDIDMAFYVPAHFDHVHETLTTHGFTTIDEPTSQIDTRGRTVLLQHEDEGYRVDLFDRQVVGKVTITQAMKQRADEFWTGNQMKASVLSAEDLFLLKTVSGGDLHAGRASDLHDLAVLAQTADFDFNTVLDEIENQRPFNTGEHEAQLLRDGAHPLLSIEISILNLSGLSRDFTSQITELATDCQIEKRVLHLVEDGTTSINDVITGTVQEIQGITDADHDRVRDAIHRLEQKTVLHSDENDRLHRRSS